MTDEEDAEAIRLRREKQVVLLLHLKRIKADFELQRDPSLDGEAKPESELLTGDCTSSATSKR